jgi:hypothetical protein
MQVTIMEKNEGGEGKTHNKNSFFMILLLVRDQATMALLCKNGVGTSGSVQTAKTGGEKKKQVESELFYHVGPTCP